MGDEPVTLRSYAHAVRERELGVRLDLARLRAFAATSAAFVADADAKDLLRQVAAEVGEIERTMEGWTNGDPRRP